MYYIKESEWKELEENHPDYCGKSIHNPKKRVIFEGCIPGNNGKGGTTLLTEGLHFSIIPDGEFTKRGSREECKAENPIDVAEKVYNLVKAARLAEPVRTEELENIKAEYGAVLYKNALVRVLNEEDAIMVKLWEAACSGEIEPLKEYYENGEKIGRTWLKFGSYHSLVAGAWRNGNYETVRYLLSVGEKPLDKEREEINLRALYLDDIITAAENVVDYFRYHNKSITKAQEWKIEELAEALQRIK